MSFAEELNPTAGEDAGATTEPTQPAAQPAPAARTYSDSDMANARRSFEADAARREQRLRAEFEQRYVAREQPKPTDPWSEFDPRVAKLLQDALDARVKPLNDEISSYKQQQADLAFANDESRIAAKYPDYQKNRADILQFAVQNGISNVDTAYRAWKYEELSQIDLKKVQRDAVAEHLKRKATQSSETPLAEGRGGGSPSTKTNFRGKDGSLDKDAMDAHAMEILSNRE